MADTSNEESERRKMGNLLREARKYIGLSQEEVAAYLKVPRTSISEIESGQRKVDSLELKRLAELYQRPTSYFTGEIAHEEFGKDIAHLARKVADLSAEDREELNKFAEYLKSRSKITKEK